MKVAEYLVYLPKTFYGATWKYMYMYTSHTMTCDFLSSMAGNHQATERFSKDWHQFIRETPALESNSSEIELHGDEKEEVEWLMNVGHVGEWTQNLGLRVSKLLIIASSLCRFRASHHDLLSLVRYRITSRDETLIPYTPSIHPHIKLYEL